MSIEKVWIEDGCISCKLCEDTCPEVFEMTDDVAKVKAGVHFDSFEDRINEAISNCPVEVIKSE